MFLVKSLERLKHPDRTIRRISRLDSQPRPFAVRFQLLVLTITSLKNLDRQNKQLGQRNLSQGMFLRSEEHTSELQSLAYLVCRLLLEKKKKTNPTSKTYLSERYV